MRNGFSVPVEIKNVDFDTYYTDMFVVSNAEFLTLQPNNDLPVTIVIDAIESRTGDYSADLKIIGFLPSGEEQYLTIQFSVKVMGTGQIIPDGDDIEPVITFSRTNVPLYTAITITIQNAYETDDVRIVSEPSYGLESSGQTKFLGNIRTDDIRFTEKGKYTLTVLVYRQAQAAPRKTKKQIILAGLSDVKLRVSLKGDFIANEPVEVIVTDEFNETVENAAIQINGQAINGSKFVPEAQTVDYTICASLEPYAPTSPCPTFSLKRKKMLLTWKPLYPAEGDELRFYVEDLDTGESLNPTISMDGKFLSSNILPILAGDHRFVFSYKDFEPIKMNLTIPPHAETIILEGSLQEKQKIFVKLDRVSSYVIYRIEESGEETPVGGYANVKIGAWTPAESGNYVIRSGETELFVTIAGSGLLDGNFFGIPHWIFFLIFVIIVLGVIYGLIKAARARNRGEGKKPLGMRLTEQSKPEQPRRL